MDTAKRGVTKTLGGMRAVALGAGAAAGGAVAAVGTAAFEVSRQTEQASRQIEASLGISRTQAEELGAVARRVFGNNFAGSVQEAGEAVALLSKQVEGVAGQEQALTETAFSITDAFGEPMDKVISAVATLTNEFEGLDPTDAFDLIAAGFQRGLNESGDFLDSIGEYSNGTFAAADFSAAEFFSTMESGQEGGVLGTDKIADAIKEFQIRITSGGDAVADGLDVLGHEFTGCVGHPQQRRRHGEGRLRRCDQQAE